MAKKRLTAVLIALYLAPIALILTGIIPHEYRFHALLGTTLRSLAGAAVIPEHRLRRLGVRTDNLRDALKWNVAFTAVCCFALYLGLHFGLVRRLPTTPHMGFFLFYVVVSCPAQEFLFRSFLWAELAAAQMTSQGLRLASMAGPFALAHVLDRDWITFATALFAGMVWSWIYSRHPNWIGR